MLCCVLVLVVGNGLCFGEWFGVGDGVCTWFVIGAVLTLGNCVG